MLPGWLLKALFSLDYLILYMHFVENFWIGARDDERNGIWRWQSDNSLAAVYTRKVGGLIFLNGEPNNEGQSGEHCLILKQPEGKASDKLCTNTYHYICQSLGIIYVFNHF